MKKPSQLQDGRPPETAAEHLTESHARSIAHDLAGKIQEIIGQSVSAQIAELIKTLDDQLLDRDLGDLPLVRLGTGEEEERNSVLKSAS
jgi:hypothetical protein